MNKADLFLEVWINTNFQYLRIRQPITCVLILDIGIEISKSPESTRELFTLLECIYHRQIFNLAVRSNCLFRAIKTIFLTYRRTTHYENIKGFIRKIPKYSQIHPTFTLRAIEP